MGTKVAQARKVKYVLDGKEITSCMALPDLTDPQKIGSAITYFRRYSLTSLLSLQCEVDDDGNKASKPTEIPVKEWLTKEQFDKAIKSDEFGIKATLRIYDGKKGFGMKKEYREALMAKSSLS